MQTVLFDAARSDKRHRRVLAGLSVRTVAAALVDVALIFAGEACQSVDGGIDVRHEERAEAIPRVGAADALAKDPAPLSRRRHVIIMIGDGMQLAHEVATSRYWHGSDRGLSFHAFPEQTYKTTWDVTTYNLRAAGLGVAEFSPVSFDPTVGYDPGLGGAVPYPVMEDSDASRAYFLSGIHPDSASTATAMSTGVKTDSAYIAWRPNAAEDGALEASPQILRRLYGMSIGFVTTVPFSHATPAAFFAHNQSRWANVAIADELMAVTQPEVMIGGGWENTNYYDKSTLDGLMARDRYVVVHREAGTDGNESILAAAREANRMGRNLMGIFGSGEDSGSSGNFPNPIPSDEPGSPKLERGSRESPTLADASNAALEVLSRDPDGFFLLIEQGDLDWANHAHDYARMIGCVSDLDAAVRSVVAFVERPGDEVDWTNTTLVVTADHANSFLRLVRPLRAGDLPRQDGDSYPDGEVTYGVDSDGTTLTQHTSELTTVYAKGFAARRVHDYETVYPGLGIIDDTSIFRLTLDAARH